jgi:hypothetical protein
MLQGRRWLARVQLLFVAAVVFAQSPPSNRKATVYFYRESAFTGSLRTFPVFVDDAQVADLTQNRYVRLTLDPGKHTLRGKTKTRFIHVQLDGGTTYYFRGETAADGWRAVWQVRQVSAEDGESMIQNLVPLDPKHVASAARSANQ